METTVEVKQVFVRDGEGNSGPWRRFDIVGTNDIRYQTYNWPKVAGSLGWEQVQPGVRLDLTYKTVQNGQYTNYVLDSVRPGVQPGQVPVPVQPAPVPFPIPAAPAPPIPAQAPAPVAAPVQAPLPPLPGAKPQPVLRTPPPAPEWDVRMDNCLTIAEHLLAARIAHADPERMMRWTVDLALAMYQDRPARGSSDAAPGITDDDIPF